MKQKLEKKMIAALIATMLSAAAPAMAGERESLEQVRSTTINLIDLLVQEGVLSKDKAEKLLKQAEAAKQKAPDKTADVPTDNKAIRVQYVPEHVKKEMRAEIEQEVMDKLNYKAGERLALPSWLDRFEWYGDLRLRYEMDRYSSNNTPAAIYQIFETRNADIANTTEERNRLRLRARLGVNVKINDWLDSGIRIVTGSITNPISPTQTLEASDSKFSFALDRAYLKAKPYSWLELDGGRMANPYFSTDLVWDPDFAVDGVNAKVTHHFNDKFSGFGVLGAHPIDEIQTSDTNKARDKWLYAAQAGVEWKFVGASSFKFAATLYDYDNVEGQANPIGDSTRFAATAPATRQKGNRTFSIDQANGNFCGQGGPCGLASQFRELNLTSQIDIARFDPVHVILTADYVHNLGFDADEIQKRTGNLYEKETDAYQVKLAVGMPNVSKKHDWQIFGAYKRLEADSVLDAFTDSNFHLGGTDSKGWVLGASYGLDKNASLIARWFSTDEISGPPLAIDVLMVDMNATF